MSSPLPVSLQADYDSRVSEAVAEYRAMCAASGQNEETVRQAGREEGRGMADTDMPRDVRDRVDHLTAATEQLTTAGGGDEGDEQTGKAESEDVTGQDDQPVRKLDYGPSAISINFCKIKIEILPFIMSELQACVSTTVPSVSYSTL